MSSNNQAIRGMKDILPEQSPYWQQLEATISQLLTSYGYENMRTPLVEKSAVFTRAIGEITDIVEKEMYTWQDNNGDYLSLRPEGTASIVRAMIEHNLVRQGVQKIWYLGAMFRRERPQKGRYRQFHQFGAEVFGVAGAKIDAELIQIGNELWQKLGLKNIQLEINSLGLLGTRKSYKIILRNYLEQYHSQLDEDSLRRLKTNPLRILDSKSPQLSDIIKNAPKITEYLDEKSQSCFEELQSHLNYLGIDFIINPTLVRGLDYYNQTVFEWISGDLGAQNSICAGGRYDGLFEQMGGKPTAASGFAIGLERLMLLTKDRLVIKKHCVCFITQGEQANNLSLKLSARLRDAIPPLIVYNNMQISSLKSQFKKADKLQADYALVLAENEVKSCTIGIKPLKNNEKQIQIEQSNLVNTMKKYYEKI